MKEPCKVCGKVHKLESTNSCPHCGTKNARTRYPNGRVVCGFCHAELKAVKETTHA